MFGENTDWANIDSFPKFLMYIVATNIINIICLNILISIVTDNYENVQQKIKAIDRKQQAQLLEDNEKIMLNKKNSGYPKYLFVISYENGLNDKTQTQQWQGRAREVKKMLQYTQEHIRKDLTQVKNELKTDQTQNDAFIQRLKNEIKDIKKNVQDVY